MRILTSLFIAALVAVPSHALAKAAPPAAKPQPAKYFLKLEKITLPKGSACKLEARATALLNRELARHPTVITSLGDKKLDAEALAAELKLRKLTGYTVALHITKCAHSLLPPQPGKAYKVLMASVAASLDGASIPSGTLAVASTEQATDVGTEVAEIDKDELQTLHFEALDAVVKRTVKQLVERLANPTPRKRPAKKRRARRRRTKRRR